MLLQPDSLTRHAVCFGMTGSGKTGLCVGILEDLAGAGVPILAIDPKGDLANLALVFPDPSAAVIEPWVPDAPREAARMGAGRTEDGISAERVQSWLDRVDVRVLTPGSEAGVPVDVLSALTRAPPWLAADPEGLREYVNGAVVSLLALIGVQADPLTDPRAILLARLLGDAFGAGRELPIDLLIPAVVDPPLSHVGWFAIDAFLPREDRLALALQLNAVISSPAFAGWRQGVPLDVDAWLSPAEKTPIQVVYTAHLDDRQRSFFVSLLLHAVVAWTRRLSGTPTLRALVYMDEVSGYLPPHPKDPPTKAPVMTLLKQARAVGVGVMLCTQNPVDVDYKAMSNAATWIVGRLQTRQDWERVRDGLVNATGEAPKDLDDKLASLPPRTFLIRDDKGLRTHRSRQTYALLRGPLTRAEVARLGAAWSGSSSLPDGALRAPPPLPSGISARWLHPAAAVQGQPGVWTAGVYARWQVRFDVAQEEATVHRWLPPGAALDDPPVELPLEDAWLLRVPPAGAGPWARLPPELADEQDVRELTRRWTAEVEMTTKVDGPEGPVFARKCRLVGMVVVWVGPGA